MSTENTTENLALQLQLGKSKVLKGHTDYVSSVYVKDNMIISSSCDKSIKIWDIRTGTCIKTLDGHTNGVLSVFVKDNLIISGSSDKTIKIWNITSGACLKTLTGHINSLRSVFAKDNLIISGSYDNTIMISPITLYPGELEVFKQVIDSYWLPRHIEREIMDYFGTDK